MAQQAGRQCIYVDANSRLLRELLLRVITTRFPGVVVSDDPSIRADVVVTTRLHDVEVEHVAVRRLEEMLEHVERSL